MKRVLLVGLFLFILQRSINADFRPPAVPLIVFSPHISVWSFSDKLTDSDTVHWSGASLPFYGLIEVDDNQVYRFLGSQPTQTPALVQTSVLVESWRTTYKFSTPDKIIELIVRFNQPVAIEDPYTYITFDVQSLDGKSHHVRVYFEEGPMLGVDNKNEKISWSRTDNNRTVLVMHAYNQIPFDIRGDATRNNWGFSYLISGNQSITRGYQASGELLRQSFVSHQPMPSDDMRKPRTADDQSPGSAFVIDFGQVKSQPVSSYIVFLYDDVYSMLYFEEYQEPCWHVELNNVYALIEEAIDYYQSNMQEITDTNILLTTMLDRVGGSQYVSLGSLVVRQITGSLTRTWSKQQNRSQLYMKEISSDGDVSTVDVIFPSSPFFLWLHPTMLRDVLLPVLAYANNETSIDYNLPWAPHHLGTWSVCDILPQEQEQMPMEESANLLLMLAGVVQRLKKTDFLQPYWNVMEVWAQYLNTSLPDPGNQLCTDDFEGPSPHNCNLALKGILGLGAYALLLNESGQTEPATMYMNQAQIHASYWIDKAMDDRHFRLQYDLPNTWSQKYNLVYQLILSMNLFTTNVSQLESNFYAEKILDFGLPLDSRSTLTKADWSSWVAAFSSTKQEQTAIWDKLYKFANESPDRVPFSDFYDAASGHVLGFRARPVMGGLFIQALLDTPFTDVVFRQTTMSHSFKRNRRVNLCNLD